MEKTTQGITVGGQDLEQYLYEKEVEKEDKCIQHTHAEQTKAPARIPMGKPKYTPRAERSGKGRKLTTKEIEMEYKDINSYTSNQQKVIAVLLKTADALTVSEIAEQIQAPKNSVGAILSQIHAGLSSNGIMARNAAGDEGPYYYNIIGDGAIKTVEQLNEMIKEYSRKGRKPKKGEPKAKATPAAAPKPTPAKATPKAKVADDGIVQGPRPEPATSGHPLSYPQIIREIAEAFRELPPGLTIGVSFTITGAPMPKDY